MRRRGWPWIERPRPEAAISSLIVVATTATTAIATPPVTSVRICASCLHRPDFQLTYLLTYLIIWEEFRRIMIIMIFSSRPAGIFV